MNVPFGPGRPCFVIAEAGVNHNGDLAAAHRLVQTAAVAGADAVKFQTFRTADLVAPGAPLADYMHRPGEDATDQAALLRRLELGRDAFAELAAACRSEGVRFMSTPFDEASAELLVEIGMDVLKVPSGELTNLPFLRRLGRLGLPTILSTGMGTLGEVEAALGTLRRAGAGPVALLHCVSAYPTPPEAANLRAMDTLAAAFQLPVGYSDHTLGLPVAFAAVARGAAVLEKHFTLDRALPGPDHAASLEPDELRAMVAGVRAIEASLGDGVKAPQAVELNTRDVARRSVAAGRDLPAGHRLAVGDLVLRRPGTGLPPSALDWLPGRTLRHALEAGRLIAPEDLG